MDSKIISSAVQEYGTPCYLYDGNKIKEQYLKLKSILPVDFEVFYSMKTNPLLGVCQLFRKFGSSIEVASGGELAVALKAGFESNNIIFTSPGKTLDELEYAIDSNIYSINVESLEEAILVDKIGKSKDKVVNISIRVNPDFNLSGAGIKMSGVSTQFGIDFSKMGSVCKTLETLSSINLIGLHVYCGTQILKAENIYNTMDAIFKMATELSSEYGFELKFLDLGGGFGIPYFKSDIELDFEDLKKGINNVFNNYKKQLTNTRIAVESGRFLMAESGVFLTKVLYIKEVKGQNYIICDGGSNLHANSAFLGRYIRNNFPQHIFNKEQSEYKNIITVAGPLCTPTDILGQKLSLPQASVGDVVVIEKSGAYGLTDSPVLFLSHPMPTEILSFDNEMFVLRERGKFTDFITNQNGLEKGILEHV